MNKIPWLGLIIIWGCFYAPLSAVGGGIDELPSWVVQKFHEQGLDQNFRFSVQKKPNHLRGDFNGDNKEDVAVLIVQKKSSKLGVAIFNQGGEVYLIGAGDPLTAIHDGDVKTIDNTNWLIKWSSGTWENPALQDKESGTILLENIENEGSIITWNGSKYISEPFEEGPD